jgi:hypothetical protein
MKPRIRFQIVAAGEEEGDLLTDPTVDAGSFHTLIILEGAWTGDKRFFVENSLTWRDLPLPFMADDTTHPEHLEATLVGNIESIERVGAELHGYGH